MQSRSIILVFSFLLTAQSIFAGGLNILSKKPVGKLNAYLSDNTISVTFNKPVAALSGQAQQENSNCPIKISPEIEGTCRWAGTQTLTFTPLQPFAYATKYTVTIPASFKSGIDGSSLDTDYKWSFETARPKIVSSKPYDGERWLSPTPYIAVLFNMEIPLQNLKSGAVLSQGRTSIPFTVRKADDEVFENFRYYGAEKENMYVFEPSASLAEGKTYSLTLKSGLMPKQGNLGMEKDEKIKFHTYGALKLASKPQAECLPHTPVLEFTNPVSAGEIAKNITFEPALKYTPCDPDNSGWSYKNVFNVELCGLEFKAGQSYKVVLSKDLTDIFGHKLGKDETFTWDNKGYCPKVSFKGGFSVMENYLPSLYPVSLLNAEGVKVEEQAFGYEDFIGFTEDDDDEKWCEKRELKGNFTAQEIASGGKNNILKKTFIDFAPLLNAKKSGFVFAQIYNPYMNNGKGCWLQATDNITGIGISLKTSPADTLIWASSLKDIKPVKGAEVEIRSADNKVLWQGKTDKNGIAKAPGWKALNVESRHYWSAPDLWVFVKNGEDVAVISNNFNDGIQPWRFNLNYDWGHSEDTFKAFTFTDRGIYRQGEKVYIKSVMRNLKNGAFDYVDFKEADIEISDARGKAVLNQTIPVNAKDSSVYYEYEIPASAPSGYWNISIKSGDLRTSASFRVEAVKPAEFEVILTPLAKQYFSGEKAEFALSAKYLFGGVFAGSPADLSFTLSRQPYIPQGWDKYSFFNGAELPVKDLVSSRVELDSKGTKNFDVKLPQVESSAVLYAQAGITSPQNQKLFARKSVYILPADIFIGVKDGQEDNRMAETGKPYDVEIAVVDAQGKLLANQEIQGKLIRKQYMSIRKTGVGGRLEWINEEKTEDITSFNLIASEGKAQWQFTPENAGSYTLVLSGKDKQGRVNSTEYSFYVADGNAYWQQTDDDLLSIKFEKEEYPVKSKAKLLIKSPYKKARALITVEREGVLDHYIKDIKGGAATITLPVKESYAPNVFVSVILLQGRAEEQKYTDDGEDLSKPQAKFGYTVLNVPPKEFEIKTSVQAERGQYRPGQTLKAAITTQDYKGRGMPASVTVFAVDTSMLSLTGYETPDLFSAFYSKRPLSVSTADNRLFVIGQRSFGQKGENRGGGGADSKLGGADLRSNFVFTPFFAASVQTDKSGNGEISFKLPDNLTKFRLMAVAASKDKFGKGQSEIEVSKPLTIKPLLPRFARAGDKFTCGFVLFNYTKENGVKADTEIKVSGGVKLIGQYPQSVSLPAGGSVKITGECQAGEEGKAVFDFRAASSNESDGLKAEVPVLQLSRQEQAFTSSVTENTEKQKLIQPQDTLKDTENKVQAILSSSILLGAYGAADYLKTYPYNCLEQQMSKLVLYTSAKDILLALNLVSEEEINKKAQKIINSADSYQTSSGGFAYWPSVDYPDLFVTSYAVDVLMHAKQNGFDVNQTVLDKASAWLNLYLSGKQKNRYEYMSWESYSAKAYGVYALALTGGNAGGYFSNLYAKRSDFGLEAKIYMLKAAALLKQETALKELSQDIINYSKITERGLHFEAPSVYYWIYTSNVKLTALVLESFLDSGLKLPQDNLVMQYFNSSAGKDGAWGNTLTNAAVIRAYNAYYKKYESQESDFKAKISENGKTVFEKSFKGRKDVSYSFESTFKDFFANDKQVILDVSKAGTGRLYYTLGLAYYPQKVDTPVSAGFKVKKEIKPLGGRNTLSAGERAEITITVSTDQERRFVVLQDYLPAGFEVVDFSLATEGREKYEDDQSGEEDDGDYSYTPFFRQEIYDDSIAAFADYMPKGTFKFTYTVSASTQGSFKVPPAWVNAMYQPEVYGRTASSTFEIK